MNDRCCQNNQTEQAWERVRAIRSPEDIRGMDEGQIARLCEDIRCVMIEQTEQNGGHLASNLGVVELTVAIHRVFNTPTDHVIFDVGHQSYVHKLLTGRAEQFELLRRPGGLSGFPNREESVHDAFGTGHASTSLSAALGFAKADRLARSDAYTVVVLGDGALTGGMIHEALNNCTPDLHLVVILNENEMSISKNVGQMARLLTKLRTAPGYSRTKTLAERVLSHIPLLGTPGIIALRKIKRRIKRIVYRSNYFESLGFNYFGPADGHDEGLIEQMLVAAKKKSGCSLIHLKTVKGKGYAPAEKTPDAYHGLAPVGAVKTDAPTFSETFGQLLAELADQNERICAITAAMRQGTGLVPFFEHHPTRAFDVGIAEEHAVTFAAGLAAGGQLPVVALYSTFLQRSYDQILHDVVLQKLPVVFAIDRAGLNERDGATHHGIFDVAFLLQFPSVELWECATTDSLKAFLTHRLTNGALTAPLAVRYPSGGDRERIVDYLTYATAIGEGVYVDFDAASPPKTVIVTYGRLTDRVLAAVRQSQENVGVMLLECLRPSNTTIELLARCAAGGSQRILVFEEGIRYGGVGMCLADALASRAPSATTMLRIMAIDTLPEPQLGQSYLSAAHLDTADILAVLQEK